MLQNTKVSVTVVVCEQLYIFLLSPWFKVCDGTLSCLHYTAMQGVFKTHSVYRIYDVMP